MHVKPAEKVYLRNRNERNRLQFSDLTTPIAGASQSLQPASVLALLQLVPRIPTTSCVLQNVAVVPSPHLRPVSTIMLCLEMDYCNTLCPRHDHECRAPAQAWRCTDLVSKCFSVSSLLLLNPQLLFYSAVSVATYHIRLWRFALLLVHTTFLHKSYFFVWNPNKKDERRWISKETLESRIIKLVTRRDIGRLRLE